MPVFADATCSQCGKRFGWTGELKDRPPCPKCGHQDKPKFKPTIKSLYSEVKKEVPAAPTVKDWEDKLDEILDKDSGLWTNEIDFIESLDSLRGSPLTLKQAAWLEKIWQRLCG